MSIFLIIGAIVLVTMLLAIVARYLNQPLIPAYLLGGILLGPIFGFITNEKEIAMLSEFGIAFLLFVIGLELEIDHLGSKIGSGILVGLLKTIIVGGIGVAVAYTLGFSGAVAITIGLLVSLSSTAVAVKLLSDKNEQESAHGKMVVIILLVEDLIAIIALSLLTASKQTTSFSLIAMFVLKLIVLTLMFLAIKRVAHFSFKFFAKSQEFLLLSSLSICFLCAAVAHILGLSVAIGAFIGGLALSALPYSYQITQRIKPLRDFFLMLFFVALGLELVFPLPPSGWLMVGIFSALVLLLKTPVLMFFMSFLGYPRQTAYPTSMYLSQSSEFSLILGALALSLGLINRSLFSVFILVTIITMFISTYLIRWKSPIRTLFAKEIKMITSFKTRFVEYEEIKSKQTYEYIILGCDRLGYNIAKTLKRLKKKTLVIEYNPDIINHLRKENIDAVYADVTELDIFDTIDMKKVKIVISTLDSFDDNSLIMEKVKAVNKETLVFLTCYNISDSMLLYEMGADYVIVPHFLGSDRVSLMIETMEDDFEEFIKTRIEHMKRIKHHHSITSLHKKGYGNHNAADR